MTTSPDDTVRDLLLLMPRLVGRAKRLPLPDALRGVDLAPRHLSLLSNLVFDGRLTVGELAQRLELAPTTVSLMVSQLAAQGVLVRVEDPADRRRRLVAISPAVRPAIKRWLAPGARAWREALAPLSERQRRVVVETLRAYEAALGRSASRR